MIFSIFRFFLHPQIPDLQIVVSQTNIVQIIHKWKYYIFSINLNFENLTLINGFVLQGHVYRVCPAQSIPFLTRTSVTTAAAVLYKYIYMCTVHVSVEMLRVD